MISDLRSQARTVGCELITQECLDDLCKEAAKSRALRRTVRDAIGAVRLYRHDFVPPYRSFQRRRLQALVDGLESALHQPQRGERNVF